MPAQPTRAAVPIHVRADEYHLLGPAESGAAGVRSREVIGPFTSIAALGPLVTVHDRVFDPRSGVMTQPYRGLERLCYVLEGSLHHDNSVRAMAGTIRSGDLAILTEGQEGMPHSERNEGDTPARAYILSYPADPLPTAASFRLVSDAAIPRRTPHPGVEVKVLVDRESELVHGGVLEFADTRFDVGGALPIVLEAGEGAVMFCVEGSLQITAEEGAPATSIGTEDTVMFPPAPEYRRVTVDAQAPARLLHAVTGTGFGFRLQEPATPEPDPLEPDPHEPRPRHPDMPGQGGGSGW